MLTVLHTYDTYRFSRNVFALTMFLPIALAFHAQKEPDGSTWYNVGPRLMSQPATSNETPYGLTPLNSMLRHEKMSHGCDTTYPE